jgi:hypothetical protein
MVWKRIKSLFVGDVEDGLQIPDVTWLDAADNPWGVPVLDRGASPNTEAEGHIPQSLAERRGEAGIVALLSGYISSAS